MDVDRNRSLNELIGRPRPEPILGSDLETAYLVACDTPLNELGVDQQRLLISLRESLDLIMPVVLDELEEDPLASGDLFAGDLLATVLRRPSTEFWAARPDFYKGVQRVLTRLRGQRLDLNLLRDVESFKQRHHR